jgi:hypothetical protein
MANNNLVLKSDLETDTDTSFYSIPGMVVLFAGDVVPSGWLHCDGSQFLESDYPLLYEALGSLFLPNLQENYLISGISNEVDYQIGSNTHTHTYRYEIPTGNVTTDPNTGSNHNQDYTYYAATDNTGGSGHTHNYGSDYYSNSGEVGIVGRGNGNNQANLISGHRHRAATIYGANFNGSTGTGGYDYANSAFNFGDLWNHNHNLSLSGGGSNQTYAHQHSITGNGTKVGTTTKYSEKLSLTYKESLPQTKYFKYIIKVG